MEHLGHLLHFSTIALTVSINSIGVGIGEGLTSYAAIKAINTQPAAQQDIARIAIIGMALIETAAVMGVAMAFFLLLANQTALNPYAASIAEIGIACALCISGFAIGLASAFPARQACHAVARQPFFADKILRFMLITQSIIQTPIIFSFIVAMFIRSQTHIIHTVPHSFMLIAAGLCIGLGSIGPATGLAIFAQHACRSLSMNRKAYGNLLTFTFISQAIIETPIIFSLTISLILLFYPTAPTTITACAWIASALCMGLGTFGPGVASGRTAAAAVEQIALNPQHYATVSKVSMFGQGLIDTCAIYSFLIAFLIILISS